ncbi:uncharacterized mitochondrial protein AtMg00810-like [Aristolochia californica]|uniref:uncharacterized mitochondrial protein AtMg00810-like n=1 Tax=Aristolochia californica TaxID=171875 RepID=UPI0035DA77E4
MDEEMQALYENQTWALVPLPPDKKLVGCEWLLIVKHNPDVFVARLKARLVAKGYTQCYDIDYEENFSPVAKLNSMNDLGLLKYFLGIEVQQCRLGIILSQRKYVLDLFEETKMLGCRPAETPLDSNTKLCVGTREEVDVRKYQRLVRRLIYLCITRLDISYAVSVIVSDSLMTENLLRDIIQWLEETWLHGGNQVVDILTKPVTHKSLSNICSKLSIYDAFSPPS